MNDDELHDLGIGDTDFADTEADGPDADDAAVDDGQEYSPTPSGWTPPELTGVDAVDGAIAVLTDLDALPTAEHVARYEVVHRQLQDALADLDGS